MLLSHHEKAATLAAQAQDAQQNLDLKVSELRSENLWLRQQLLARDQGAAGRDEAVLRPPEVDAHPPPGSAVDLSVPREVWSDSASPDILQLRCSQPSILESMRVKHFMSRSSEARSSISKVGTSRRSSKASEEVSRKTDWAKPRRSRVCFSSRRRSAMEKIFGGCRSSEDRLKEVVRKIVSDGPEYNVHDLYHQEGKAQAIARSARFESIVLGVITFNALWLAIESDAIKSTSSLDRPIIFQVMDHLLCIFYLGEWLVRYLAFESKLNAFRDYWFIFDSVLMLGMVFDTWFLYVIMAVLPHPQRSDIPLQDGSFLRLMKLVRMTRIARVAKLLRACPEVVILIKGVASAARSVFFTLCLLLMVIYAFALFFTQLTRGYPVHDLYWRTVPHSIFTLLFHGCFGENLPDVVLATGQSHVVFAIVLTVFVLLASLTLLNMLVGVLVEVVQNVAQSEKDAMSAQFVTQQLQESWSELDANSDGEISCVEFENLLEKPTAVQALHQVGVDVLSLVETSKYIFRQEPYMNFDRFIDVVMHLRGSKTATVKDIIDLRKSLFSELDRLESILRPVLELSQFPHPEGSQFLRRTCG